MRYYIRLLSRRGVKIEGAPRYIGVHVRFDDPRLISIGDRSTISDDCHLLTHDYSITNVYRAVGRELSSDVAIIREIRIGNNVFVGKKSIIMPGVVIEDDCVIGAGAVVRGRIPKGSVVVGNPAQVVGTVEALALKWEKTLSEDHLRVD